MATMNLTVGASTDDADQKQDGSSIDLTGTQEIITAHTSAATRNVVGFRFDPSGTTEFGPKSTITTATWSVNVVNTSRDDASMDVYCEAADNSVTFGVGDGPNDRTKTSASTAWSEDSTGTGYQSPPVSNLNDEVHEVIRRPGYSRGNAITVLAVGRNGATKQLQIYMQDNGSNEAKLDITFTPPLYRPAPMTGIGCGGPFFANPLG